MTTLNEKAREYAIEYLHGTTNEQEFMDNEHLLPFKDAVKAIDIALNEATRWRDVNAELPKVDDKGISKYVLAEIMYNTYEVLIYCKNEAHPNGWWSSLTQDGSFHPIKWRPIETI